MLRRYLVVSVLIMAVSLASAGLVNAATSTVTFQSTCTFQVFIHLSRSAVTTPEHAKFINSLAQQQVNTAVTVSLLQEVAKKQKVPAAAVRLNSGVLPAAGLGAYQAVVVNPNAKTSIRLTNALCTDSVAAIKARRAAQIDAQVKEVKSRIPRIEAELKRLERIPANRRTSANRASINGQRNALGFNYALIAEITSLPPDEISVLSPAASAQRKQTGSLSRNLIIALVAGLLACFLYILVGEIYVERRRALSATTQSASA